MTNTTVDWLSYVFLDRTVEEVAKDFSWEVEELEAPGHGGSGYQECLIKDDIRIYHGGREDMGVLVVLSGKGCRSLEGMACFFHWQEWIAGILRMRARITRIDMAIDDRSGVLDMALIEEKTRSREWVGRTRSYGVIASSKGGGSEGRTTYFGAKTSEILVRIYDKAIEQGVEGPWIRVEIQMRKQRAHEFAFLFAKVKSESDQSDLVRRLIKNYLRFVEPGEGQVQSRWATSPWWDQFLGAVDALSIVGPPTDNTIDRRKDWLMRTVAPTLALVVTADGGSRDYIEELIWEGRGRISEKDWKLATGQADLNLDFRRHKKAS